MAEKLLNEETYKQYKIQHIEIGNGTTYRVFTPEGKQLNPKTFGGFISSDAAKTAIDKLVDPPPAKSV